MNFYTLLLRTVIILEPTENTAIVNVKNILFQISSCNIWNKYFCVNIKWFSSY